MAAPTASEERYATSVEGNDETPSNITIDYVALFTCSNEVIKNTTAEYNLTEVWETFEPAFLDHLANLTACPSVGDEDAVQVCQQTVLQAANTTYRTFFNVVKEVRSRERWNTNAIFNLNLFFPAAEPRGRRCNLSKILCHMSPDLTTGRSNRRTSRRRFVRIEW